MNKLKALELFGGIGACSKALERLGIDYEIADYVEIDKYAVESFNAMHGTDFEPQDICEWNKDIEVDLIMHGSPCQDFSLAGKQAGGDEGSGTRSSLMYETIRIVEKLKPKYVIWENVKNVISKKHKHNYDNYCNKMSELGYMSYGKVLNAKDYGIPQNRERVFTISIQKDLEKSFKFPPKQELKLRLKDMLENEVDEKYYLSDTQINRIKTIIYNVDKTRIQKKDWCDTLCARDRKDPKCVRIGGIFDTENSKHQAGSIYDKEGISPTLDVMQGGWRQPSIITYNMTQRVKVRKYDVDTKKLIETLRNAKLELDITNKELAEKLNIPVTQIEHYFRKDNSFAIPEPKIWLQLKELLNINTDEFDESIMTFEEKDGTYDKANRIYDENGIMATLTQQEEKILINNGTKKGYVVLKHKNKRLEKIIEKTNFQEGKVLNLDLYNQTTNENVSQCLTEPHHNSQRLYDGFRIRKLTPKECWRLMGFDDEDFEKASQVCSNTQLYKQAGNSIVVNVLEEILKELLC